jgi:hypothetical protein
MNITVVARRINATPARSAAEAWVLITDLLSAHDSSARQELNRVSGIVCSLIAAEALRDSPLVVSGSGARLRIYCLYGDEAVLGENASEGALAWCPTEGNWSLSLPCLSEDLSWVQAALARVSTRITARDAAELAPTEGTDSESSATATAFSINREAFFRP